MGKLRDFFTWWRDAVPPLSRDERAKACRSADLRRHDREVAELRRTPKVDDTLRAPHYYVFFYRDDQIRGGRVLPAAESGWKYPKEVRGPLKSMAEARARVADELASYKASSAAWRQARSQYKIRRLTADQFKTIWGSPPSVALGGGY